MPTPIQRDNLSHHQLVLHKFMRLASPVSQLFNGNDLQASEFLNSRVIEVPDIRVDDYITDTQLSRIGADHRSGSQFTGEWKNGMPPIEWRKYSTSRHRSFGYVVFEEQEQYSPLKNLPQEYLARKMSTTVLRDHDKYLLLAIVLGRMTGKLVARTPEDAIGPVTTDAHRIACTGNQADYKWIAEAGEYTDNEVQPGFATIKAMTLDAEDPLNTLTALNIQFSDNWFDDNFGTNRFFLITSAMEAVITEKLIEKGTYVEGGWKLYQDAKVSGTTGNSYLGTLRGWNLIKIHPEFLPKVFVKSDLTIDPNPTLTDVGTATGSTLRQIVAIAAYRESAQVHDFFSDKREEDGGIRFKGKEYAQDMSYDAWVIDQKSEGIVPIVLPADLDGNGTTDTDYTRVDTSFTQVASMLSAARTQLTTYPSQYPASGADVAPSTPIWFQSPYTSSTNIDSNLDVTDAGDVSGNYPASAADDPASGFNDLASAVEDLEGRVEDLEA